jgi:hypothetical protein
MNKDHIKTINLIKETYIRAFYYKIRRLEEQTNFIINHNFNNI